MLPILDEEEFIRKIHSGNYFWIVEYRDPEKNPVILRAQFVSVMLHIKNKKRTYCAYISIVAPENIERAKSLAEYLDEVGFSKLLNLDEFGLFKFERESREWLEIRNMDFERRKTKIQCALIT